MESSSSNSDPSPQLSSRALVELESEDSVRKEMSTESQVILTTPTSALWIHEPSPSSLCCWFNEEVTSSLLTVARLSVKNEWFCSNSVDGESCFCHNHSLLGSHMYGKTVTRDGVWTQRLFHREVDEKLNSLTVRGPSVEACMKEVSEYVSSTNRRLTHTSTAMAMSQYVMRQTVDYTETHQEVRRLVREQIHTN